MSSLIAFVLLFISVSCTLEVIIIISEKKKSGNYMRLAAGFTGLLWATTAAFAGWV